MKRTEAKRIDQIISEALDASGTRDSFNSQQACYLWTEIVGPSINRQTTRRWVDHDVLHVCITSASLKNELSMMASAIIDRLNRAVGANTITKIVFH